MKKRTENHKLILAKLRLNGPSTKYDLADQLNISIPTVTTSINQLLSEGLVQEAGLAETDYGRKPILIDINTSNLFSIGLDIGPKHIHCYVMNLKFEMSYSCTFSIENQDLSQAIKQSISHCLKEKNLLIHQISGVGLSYPGIVDTDHLILKTATNMALDHTDLKPLQEYFNLPFYVGNEANLAAYAENIIGSSKTFYNVVYLSINEGIGAGIIIDQKYYSGSNHAGGEIGHMIIEKGGRPCSCGAKGCSEAYLSINTLLENFNQATDHSCSSLSELFACYDSTNILHTSVLSNYIDYLIITLNNLFLIFDPDSIFIGGALNKYNNFFKDYLLTHLNTESSRILATNRSITFSTLGDDASRYGACLIALENTTSLL
ncbi:MAG: ROK family transcriptional regulator [Cellulosilyticaceae bacterium]